MTHQPKHRAEQQARLHRAGPQPLYFLVEVTPRQEDCKADPSDPGIQPNTWDGVTFENEEAYRAHIVSEVLFDIGELDSIWETKIMQLPDEEVYQQLKQALQNQPDQPTQDQPEGVQ